MSWEKTKKIYIYVDMYTICMLHHPLRKRCQSESLSLGVALPLAGRASRKPRSQPQFQVGAKRTTSDEVSRHRCVRDHKRKKRNSAIFRHEHDSLGNYVNRCIGKDQPLFGTWSFLVWTFFYREKDRDRVTERETKKEQIWAWNAPSLIGPDLRRTEFAEFPEHSNGHLVSLAYLSFHSLRQSGILVDSLDEYILEHKIQLLLIWWWFRDGQKNQTAAILNVKMGFMRVSTASAVFSTLRMLHGGVKCFHIWLGPLSLFPCEHHRHGTMLMLLRLRQKSQSRRNIGPALKWGYLNKTQEKKKDRYSSLSCWIMFIYLQFLHVLNAQIASSYYRLQCGATSWQLMSAPVCLLWRGLSLVSPTVWDFRMRTVHFRSVEWVCFAYTLDVFVCMGTGVFRRAFLPQNEFMELCQLFFFLLVNVRSV